ncbi:LuxR C-terminal-related transcriptional regulator [Scandinavium sp. V105_16]|uniref:LuxR C-terminal-related transcriptional regulator n=1 Tax=Scandinavium lactucae TaxID=3095028 RepID=A0AAJ2VVV4_9ENTR|nr:MULTISPECIES: LuxR C-terminal-related transcriptional regulator [unclassified Scandinavium]MDX6018761.1 LuxR C-terminal-related transcriptional regulator [Scandinavium sp. V105_16]MDX6030278.1 LuxR C-terminal-related transcriptional regulator [Scandinavium sp. V105_12]MDX6039056.1 LuxR C-terminal-related transcriptional regulator [Scandinavium sp. V105_6]MDX6050127.1 LuxR C-terminal-related transcriptional regulator [Scandinavium sp. V105_1]
MLQIVIEDKNTLYRKGMEILLEQIFLREEGEWVEFLPLTEDHVAVADVIVKNFEPGESYICNSVLRGRKSASLLIGIYEGDTNPHFGELPLCVNNIVFINRAESLSKTRALILRGWDNRAQTAPRNSRQTCQGCLHRTLSPQQVKVAAHFYRGYNPEKTASDLQLNVKTVCAHKRMIMTKFNLYSDCELLHFLDGLKNQKLTPNVFSEFLAGN